MKEEEQLVREYFGDPKGDHTEAEIMKNARMMEHMKWHSDDANIFRLGNYGEPFLDFHKQYVEKFDSFRISKGLFRISSWDPSTPIPARLAHEVPLLIKKDALHPKGGLRNTQQTIDNIKRYIDELLPEEYEKCLVGLTAITKEAWNTAHNSEDNREKIQALSLAKECYLMKLDLLTNATVVDDAIRFVSQKSKENLKSSTEGDKEESDQLEE
jgi:hypothetical protein